MNDHPHLSAFRPGRALHGHVFGRPGYERRSNLFRKKMAMGFISTRKPSNTKDSRRCPHHKTPFGAVGPDEIWVGRSKHHCATSDPDHDDAPDA
ncbi:hypothetical protein [Paracoccus sediminilitoris]|uniref:hypothetical protein n=1 Tax=Paracoccus sediminilitoris TaxID=2202419 RepID=UPI0013147531|nr:hypothetical protein [Paracoccus sediminilitoris]